MTFVVVWRELASFVLLLSWVSEFLVGRKRQVASVCVCTIHIQVHHCKPPPTRQILVRLMRLSRAGIAEVDGGERERGGGEEDKEVLEEAVLLPFPSP